MVEEAALLLGKCELPLPLVGVLEGSEHLVAALRCVGVAAKAGAGAASLDGDVEGGEVLAVGEPALEELLAVAQVLLAAGRVRERWGRRGLVPDDSDEFADDRASAHDSCTTEVLHRPSLRRRASLITWAGSGCGRGGGGEDLFPMIRMSLLTTGPRHTTVAPAKCYTAQACEGEPRS